MFYACSLLNDAVGTAGYIQSKGEMTVNNELKGKRPLVRPRCRGMALTRQATDYTITLRGGRATIVAEEKQ